MNSLLEMIDPTTEESAAGLEPKTSRLAGSIEFVCLMFVPAAQPALSRFLDLKITVEHNDGKAPLLGIITPSSPRLQLRRYLALALLAIALLLSCYIFRSMMWTFVLLLTCFAGAVGCLISTRDNPQAPRDTTHIPDGHIMYHIMHPIMYPIMYPIMHPIMYHRFPIKSLR